MHKTPLSVLSIYVSISLSLSFVGAMKAEYKRLEEYFPKLQELADQEGEEGDEGEYEDDEDD